MYAQHLLLGNRKIDKYIRPTIVDSFLQLLFLTDTQMYFLLNQQFK